jgi:hypothetical protein
MPWAKDVFGFASQDHFVMHRQEAGVVAKTAEGPLVAVSA